MRFLLADTWKQPNANDESSFIANNEEISLNRLNTYCLLDVFNYLNAKSLLNLCHVCSNFNDIIQIHIFPQQRKISLDLINDSGDNISYFLNSSANILPYAYEIIFTARTYVHPSNHIRLMDIFTKNLNEDLYRLDLVEVCITVRMYDQMKPVLKQLKIFKWIYYYHKSELDLINVCTDLKKLKLIRFINFNINTDKWQSLESLTFCLQYSDSNDGICRFIRNNLQLKRLKINIQYHIQIVINEIGLHLENLEILEIFHGRNTRDNDVIDFRCLLQLKNLKHLKLSYVFIPNDYYYEAFFAILCRLLNLEKLEFILDYAYESEFFAPENCQLLALARNLANLREFYIGKHKITEDVFIEFIKAKPKLTVFELNRCRLKLNTNLLKSISNIRKSQSLVQKLNCQPLKLYVNSEAFLNENGYDNVKVHLGKQSIHEFSSFL